MPKKPITNRRCTHSTQVTHFSLNATRLPPRELLTAFTCIGPTFTLTPAITNSAQSQYNLKTNPIQTQHNSTLPHLIFLTQLPSLTHLLVLGCTASSLVRGDSRKQSGLFLENRHLLACRRFSLFLLCHFTQHFIYREQITPPPPRHH